MNEYWLYVNEARTVLVRMSWDGKVEVALRETPEHVWGPPIACPEEHLPRKIVAEAS